MHPRFLTPRISVAEAPSSARRLAIVCRNACTRAPVNVTGTDTSYRWVCDGDRFDKCLYDGPD